MITKTGIIFSSGKTAYHEGTAGVTITLDTRPIVPQIYIEYDSVTKPEMITMITDLLHMCHERMPGVSENAIFNFMKDTGMYDPKTGLAKISYKKG